MAIISKKLSTKRSSRKVSKRSSIKVSTKRSSRKVSTKRSSRKAHKGGTIKSITSGWGFIRNKFHPRRRPVSSYPSIYDANRASLRNVYEMAKKRENKARKLGKKNEARTHREEMRTAKREIKSLTKRDKRGTKKGRQLQKKFRKGTGIRRKASTNLENLIKYELSLQGLEVIGRYNNVSRTKNKIAMLKQTMIEDLMTKLNMQIKKSTKNDIKNLSSKNMEELIYSKNLTIADIEKKISEARERAQKKGALINKGRKAFNDNIYKQIFQNQQEFSSKNTSYNNLAELSLKEYLRQFKNNILSNSNLNNIVNTVRRNENKKRKQLLEELTYETNLLKQIQSKVEQKKNIFENQTDNDYQIMLDTLKRLTDFDDTHKYEEKTDSKILGFLINLRDHLKRTDQSKKKIKEAEEIIKKIEKAKEYKEAAAERAESERKAAEQAVEQAAAEKAAAEEARIAAEEARIAAEEARIAAEKAAAEKEAAERVTAEQESEQYSGFEGLNILY